MSPKDILRTMVEYHAASSRRMLQHLSEHLTDEQFIEKMPYSHGSIRHQVVHIAATDRYWLHDIQSKAVTGLDPQDYPTIASFAPVWEGIEQTLVEYTRSLSDEQLEDTPAGLLLARWEALAHVVNHGTDHRAQILSMLHSLGVPTFEQDFPNFLRSHRWVSKNKVLDLVLFWWGEWKKSLFLVPSERMNEPVVGSWSVKDIIAHITWHDREMVGVLKTRRLCGSEWWDLPLEDRNQRIFEQHHSQPLGEVVQEHEQVHRQLLEQLERLDDHDLNDPSRISEMLPGLKPWMLLEDNTWAHYMNHTETLWAWLKHN
jgi:uncharacterized damage-inducible protein DinB